MPLKDSRSFFLYQIATCVFNVYFIVTLILGYIAFDNTYIDVNIYIFVFALLS